MQILFYQQFFGHEFSLIKSFFLYAPEGGKPWVYYPREITFNQISITLSKGNYIIKTKLWFLKIITKGEQIFANCVEASLNSIIQPLFLL